VLRLKDIFIVHHSVFNDAFRNDYDTAFKDSSKNFFEMLLNHWIKNKQKIAFTSGEVYTKLYNTSVGKTKTFGIIHEYLCEIDFSTFNQTNPKISIEQSIFRLASKKCIEFSPFVVATNPKDKIKQDGTTFSVLTPKEAIEMYNDNGSRF